MNKFRFKPLLLLSILLSAPLTLILGLIGSSIPFIWLTLLLLFAGGIRTIGMTLFNTITFADTNQEVMAHANTITNMVQQLASVIAVAIAVIALNLGRVLAGTQNQFTFAFSSAVLVLAISLWNVTSLPGTAGDSLRK